MIPLHEVNSVVLNVLDESASAVKAMISFSKEYFARNGGFNPWDYFEAHMQKFDDVEDGRPKMAARNCTINSIKRLVDGLAYCEGFAVVHGVPLVHAWNYNPETKKAVDFTLVPNKNTEYFGIIIPIAVVLMAARHKGWSSSVGVLETLRFFKEKEMEKVAKHLK